MAKRKKYYQVHKNKKPRVNQDLKFINLRNHYYDIAKAASKARGPLMSLEFAIAQGVDKIGQLVFFLDSPGGSI